MLGDHMREIAPADERRGHVRLLVWLCYLDESGNTGRKLDGKREPVHWIAAAMVPEECAVPLTEQVELVLHETLVDGWSLPATVELHGVDMYRGKGHWEGVSESIRMDVYRRILALLAVHECAVVFASIDKARLKARYDYPESPHLLALQFLVEKIDGVVAGELNPLRQRALLVADESKEHELGAISLVATMQRVGGAIGPAKPTKHILDCIHFVRSKDSRGVQLADLVVYLLNRNRRMPSDPTDSRDVAMKEMFKSELNNVVRSWRNTWPTV